MTLRLGGKYLSRSKRYEITVLRAEGSKWVTSYKLLKTGKLYKEYLLENDGTWFQGGRYPGNDAVYPLSTTEQYCLEE